MRDIYLIDFENVSSDGLSGITYLTEEDEVIIFYSSNSNRLSMKMHILIGKSVCKLDYFEVSVGGKNALDHQIATWLGYLIGTGAAEHYYIVSKDTGYKHVANFWAVNDGRPNVHCADSIRGAIRLGRSIRNRELGNQQVENHLPEERLPEQPEPQETSGQEEVQAGPEPQLQGAPQAQTEPQPQAEPQTPPEPAQAADQQEALDAGGPSPEPSSEPVAEQPEAPLEAAPETPEIIEPVAVPAQLAAPAAEGPEMEATAEPLEPANGLEPAIGQEEPKKAAQRQPQRRQRAKNPRRQDTPNRGRKQEQKNGNHGAKPVQKSANVKAEKQDKADKQPHLEQLHALVAPYPSLQESTLRELIANNKRQILCNTLRKQLGQEKGLALYNEIKKSAWK